MTAPKPEGPYGERVLVRNVESDQFHPPLLEFYPAFVHQGYVYAPATSVALNRDFNALFRAPLERATEPKAWELTLVHFAKRLRVLGQRLEQIKDVHLRGQWRDNIPLFKLSSELQKISADKGLLSTLEALDLKSEVFDQLRGAMRIAQTGQTTGLNSGSNPIALGSTEIWKTPTTSKSCSMVNLLWKNASPKSQSIPFEKNYKRPQTLRKKSPPKSVNSSTYRLSQKPFAVYSTKPRKTEIQRSFVIIAPYAYGQA